MSDFSAMLEEIREYFYYKYFSPDLAILQNFNGAEIERFLPYLIIGICGGIFIAAIATYYSSDFLGRPVRRLYKAGAFAPENAKTLGEIGCDKRLIRKNLRRPSVLSKYVVTEDSNENDGQTRTARFFLRESDKYIADKRFKPVKGGFAMLLITLALCVILCFLLLYYVPELLVLADNAITMIKN